MKFKLLARFTVAGREINIGLRPRVTVMYDAVTYEGITMRTVSLPLVWFSLITLDDK